MPSDPAATTDFREGLLEGVGVAVAGAGELGAAAARRCRSLGARVAEIECRFEDEAAAVAATEQAGRIDTLVVDAAAMFAAAAGGADDGLDAFRAAVDGAWNIARAAATGGMIGSNEGGKIVLIAPAPGAGAHAGAARAALENTARTVSVEWARFQVRTTVIAPADATTAEDVAALAAYLASHAGDYFSGCRFSLGEAVPAGREADAPAGAREVAARDADAPPRAAEVAGRDADAPARDAEVAGRDADAPARDAEVAGRDADAPATPDGSG